MNAERTPRFTLLPYSQLQEDSWHAILICLLRGVAALQVAAAHLRAEFFPGLRGLEDPALWYQGLAFLTGFAHQAVLVFFLISGWLVGGSFLNKRGQPGAVRLYAIDRITRLWTVLIPTFALILAFGIVTGTLDPRSVDLARTNDHSALVFAGNLVGLQTILVPNFGGNFPLWSLANESWYYLMFPLLVLSFIGRRRVAAAAALILLTVLLPFEMVLYFSIWLLGAAFSRVRFVCGNLLRAALLAVLVTLSVYFRLTGSNGDLVPASYFQDLLLSVLFLVFLSSTIVKPVADPRWIAPLRRCASTLSNFSFTLYVVHVPVLGMLRWIGLHLFGRSALHPDRLADLGIYLAMLGVVTVFAYGFYLLFEARTYQIRWRVKHWLAGTDGAITVKGS